MLSVPQMLWLVKYACENRSRALLVGDSTQHRKSVWELVEALGRLKPQSKNPIMPAL